MSDRAGIALALHRVGAVKFGDFVLKDGRHSPFYIDLRVIIADPALLRLLAGAMLEAVRGVSFDCIAAIPYAGLPLGVAMALESGRPLVYPRKEAKDYGTRRQVEGVFTTGDRALVVDDVITTGGAKLEAIAPLRAAGLVVEDVVVVVDREQAPADVLAAGGLRLHSVLRVSDLLRHLEAAGVAAPQDVRHALQFIGR